MTGRKFRRALERRYPRIGRDRRSRGSTRSARGGERTRLRAAGAAEAVVRHVEVRPLAVASAAGDLAGLSWPSSWRAGARPATLVAKAPGSGPAQRALEAAMGLFARERYVYANLASALPVCLPRCYYPGDPDKQEPMLLEDLVALRAWRSGHRPGPHRR